MRTAPCFWERELNYPESSPDHASGKGFEDEYKDDIDQNKQPLQKELNCVLGTDTIFRDVVKERAVTLAREQLPLLHRYEIDHSAPQSSVSYQRVDLEETLGEF